MLIHRMMIRIILRENISRKSFRKNSKKHIYGVLLRFENICLITKHNDTCGKLLILAGVACNVTPNQIFFTFSNEVNSPKCKACHIFSLFLILFQISRKKEFSQIYSFQKSLKHHQYFHFTPTPAKSNAPISQMRVQTPLFLNTFLTEYLLIWKDTTSFC